MTTSLQSIVNPKYKQEIFIFLENFIQKKSEELILVNSFGSDIKEKFLEFISQGKMIRGSLIFCSYSLFARNFSEEVVKTAAAIELMHSSLLAHDDIMDQDLLRRGKKSIFAQYKEFGEKNKFKNSLHFGESMGICLGDIGFFLAFELLSDISIKAIFKAFSKELSYVVLAQMQDVSQGFSSENLTMDSIIKLYKYKTGRYTFSLPFLVGAMLANQGKKILSNLEKIGELLGILFQLKDDELGIFGNEEELGKPVGSDIREDKKTLYRELIFQKASLDERKKLKKIFGSDNLLASDIYYVQNLYVKFGIEKEIKKHIEEIRNNIDLFVKQLPINSKDKDFFYNLLKYNLERKK